MKILNPAVNIGEFFKKIEAGSLLMLDYDGTLAPFNEKRMEAFPYQGILERLKKLMEIDSNRVVIVSGRALDELSHLLGLSSDLELWGSHGLQRRLSSGKELCSELDPEIRDGLNIGRQHCLGKIDEKHLEIKPFSIALHWRGVEEPKELEALKSVELLWGKQAPQFGLEAFSFDGGVELRPKGKGKGDVVRQLLSETSRGISIAYLGDDFTDEEAFAELGDKGLKVLVRERNRDTLADVQLIPPNELLDFLDEWILYSHGDS